MMQTTNVQISSGLSAILIVVFALAVACFVIFVWGTIFRKAGYSFWMALLMFIPLVNLIWLLIFAFSRWPAMQELETYRSRYGSLQQGFAMAPQGYAPTAQASPSQTPPA